MRALGFLAAGLSTDKKNYWFISSSSLNYMKTAWHLEKSLRPDRDKIPELLQYPSSLRLGHPSIMDKKQFLNRLDKAWVALQDSFAGLSDSQLTEPGVTGDWSVKDILAHVTTWEEEALKYLPLILKGGRSPRYSEKYGGIDAFNAWMAEEKRDLSLSDVLRQLEESHQRLIDYVHSVPEDQFIQETRFRRRLRFDTYRHYSEHAKMIREWREHPAE